MAQIKSTRANRKLTASEKRRIASVRERIEREFPPGSIVRSPAKLPRTSKLGDFFDLRAAVHALKSARESKGLSLSDLERATGIDRSAISRIENSENGNPTINTLSRYARALGKQIAIALVDIDSSVKPPHRAV